MLAGVNAPTTESSFSALEISSVLSRYMVHITENHDPTQYRDQRILGSPAAMDTSSSDINEDRMKRLQIPEDQAVCCANVFPRNGFQNQDSDSENDTINRHAGADGEKKKLMKSPF